MRISIGEWYGEVENFAMRALHFRAARTFDDLLAINIDDLLWERDAPPEYPVGGEDYKQRLSADIALNQAGVLTGLSTDGGVRAGIEFRALVIGLAYDGTKDWLHETLEDSPYEMLAWRVFVPNPDRVRGYGIKSLRETVSGRETCESGWQPTRRDLFRDYPVRRALGKELRYAWQITVYDPQWGESNLHSFLHGVAAERAANLQTGASR